MKEVYWMDSRRSTVRYILDILFIHFFYFLIFFFFLIFPFCMTRMARTLARMTRMASWLAHQADPAFHVCNNPPIRLCQQTVLYAMKEVLLVSEMNSKQI